MNLLHSNVQYIKSNRSPDLVFSFLSSPLPSLFPSLSSLLPTLLLRFLPLSFFLLCFPPFLAPSLFSIFFLSSLITYFLLCFCPFLLLLWPLPSLPSLVPSLSPYLHPVFLSLSFSLSQPPLGARSSFADSSLGKHTKVPAIARTWQTVFP